MSIIPMIEKQPKAKIGNGTPIRKSHSTPAMDAIVAPNSTRLMMYAIGNAVENEKRDGKARERGGEPQQSALLKNWFHSPSFPSYKPGDL